VKVDVVELATDANVSVASRPGLPPPPPNTECLDDREEGILL
jgi:hypothetical protein